jgi:hypothetical protein
VGSRGGGGGACPDRGRVQGRLAQQALKPWGKGMAWATQQQFERAASPRQQSQETSTVPPFTRYLPGLRHAAPTRNSALCPSRPPAAGVQPRSSCPVGRGLRTGMTHQPCSTKCSTKPCLACHVAPRFLQLSAPFWDALQRLTSSARHFQPAAGLEAGPHLHAYLAVPNLLVVRAVGHEHVSQRLQALGRRHPRVAREGARQVLRRDRRRVFMRYASPAARHPRGLPWGPAATHSLRPSATAAWRGGRW